MTSKVVLVTGCSTGIGLETAVLLARDKDQRFKVFATMRNLAKKPKLEIAAGAALDKTLFVRQLDVTKQNSIEDFIDKINREEGGVDVLSKLLFFLFPCYFRFKPGLLTMAAKVVLVTGCSTGIGLETAVLFANDQEKRFKVFATMRNLAKKEELEKAAGANLNKTLFIRELDVNKKESRENFLKKLKEEAGDVDILSKDCIK